MKLFVKDERLTSPIQPATRKDRLGADGWIPCGMCEDGWQDCGTGTFDHACPDCAHGLIPPEGMVEAAAKAAFEARHPNGRWNRQRTFSKDKWRETQRATLIAAARWEANNG